MIQLPSNSSPEEIVVGKQRVKAAAATIRDWSARHRQSRDGEMIIAILRGASLKDVATEYNLTTGRVRAIVAQATVALEIDREFGHFNL